MSGDEESGDLWLKTFQEISVKLLAGTVVSSEGAIHGEFASKMTHGVLGKNPPPTGCWMRTLDPPSSWPEASLGSVIPGSFHKAIIA